MEKDNPNILKRNFQRLTRIGAIAGGLALLPFSPDLADDIFEWAKERAVSKHDSGK